MGTYWSQLSWICQNSLRINIEFMPVANSHFLHKIPKDLQELFDSNKDVQEKWRTLTPLTQNEWICWITIVKKIETRQKHLVRFCEDLRRGKRRPCCWPGCPHRRETASKYFK
jgi:Bacteriocin-protection, YdeI or OmpD-Associated